MSGRQSAQAGNRRGGWRTPRSRGLATGFGLILLGAWGALIPFIGPAFHYAYTPNSSWTWTQGRFWLEVVPGAVTALAGLVVLTSNRRLAPLSAAWLAVAAGAWFIVGPLLAPIWRTNYIGVPTGHTTRQAVERIGFFYGLGGAIILLGALAAGRFSVVSVRDVRASRAAKEPEAPAEPEAPRAQEVHEVHEVHDRPEVREAYQVREPAEPGSVQTGSRRRQRDDVVDLGDDSSEDGAHEARPRRGLLGRSRRPQDEVDGTRVP